jgi:hypothetical protein
VSCPRHPRGDGPHWCQDCHGFHEILTPEQATRLRLKSEELIEAAARAPAKLGYTPGRFDEAANTLVLDRSHGQGIRRGAMGQAFAAEQLGATQARGENAAYDLLVKDGTRVDVKTTKWGNPLMIPVSQKYKLAPERVDAFLLVWDGPEPELKGQISVREFARRHRTEGLVFPVPTMWFAAFDLDPIPPEWYTVEGTLV